jgi:hypothetical protein
MLRTAPAAASSAIASTHPIGNACGALTLSEMAASAGAGKRSRAPIKSCPVFQNAFADGPPRGGRNVFPIRARGEKIMFPAMTSGIAFALIFRTISRKTDRLRLGAPLHPLRQSAAVVLQQKRSHAKAFTDDAVRFGITSGTRDPLLPHAVLSGGKPLLR